MRHLRLATLLALLALVSALGLHRLGAFEGALTWWSRARPPQPTVLLIVLDTLRADHLSVCGYARPTSPTLQALVDAGARLSCDATAPGTWTVPSHASYFTGLDVAAHGAHYVADSSLTFGEDIGLSPLGLEPQTLAEAFVARGYQAVSLSGNPLIRAETGLARGFQHIRHGAGFGELRGERFASALREIVRDVVDPETPLFLFLNIADAHQPWSNVPEGLGWLPAQPNVSLTPAYGEMPKFLLGQMSPAQASAYTQRVTNAYDYGAWQADQTLAQSLAVLRAHGWLNEESHVIITSDHGEFLGEHGLLDHGRYTWQEDVQVPLLMMGPGTPEALPEPLSTVDVFTLTLRGQLDSPSPVRVAAWPDGSWLRHLDGELGGHTTAALRVGSEKWVWTDGEVQRFDLASDPGELHPLEVPEDHPQRAALLVWAERVKADAMRAQAMDPALLEALRAAGYME
ncbi:MAG: sulfatase-like hydrolase/transferase [Alphaproteobacteria bacterium]|nr:sulfatase-like hydrolase/transferase [Alphaproteobacteria bacterium]